MKLINKNDCTFEDGIITIGDEVIGLSSHVFEQLDDLEHIYQMALHLADQPDANGGPNLDDFKFNSEAEANLPVFVPDTPALDARVQESLAFMEDLDSVDFCNKMNKVVAQFKELIEFTQKNRFIPGNGWKFDLHYVGNPLELTEGRLMDMLEFCTRQRERFGKPYPLDQLGVLEF